MSSNGALDPIRGSLDDKRPESGEADQRFGHYQGGIKASPTTSPRASPKASPRTSNDWPRPRLYLGRSSISSLRQQNGEKPDTSSSDHSVEGVALVSHDFTSQKNHIQPDQVSIAGTDGKAAEYMHSAADGRKSEGNETESWHSTRARSPAGLKARVSAIDFTDEKQRNEQPKPRHWVVNHHQEGMVFAIEKEKENDWLGARKIYNMARNSRSRKQDDQENGSPRTNGDKSFRINLAELQRMHLRKVQSRLAKHVIDMRFRNEEPAGWEDDLQMYIKGYQDYEYMIKCSQSLRDPFLITGERKVDDFVIHKALDGLTAENFTINDLGKPILVRGPWEEENEPIGGTRNENVAKSWSINFRNRLLMATIGGVMLIAPMWLMVLHNTLYTGLVATTVFVALFGAVMSLTLPEPKEVMSATAAYAAVLVVFVGLNTGGNDA